MAKWRALAVKLLVAAQADEWMENWLNHAKRMTREWIRKSYMTF
ncbi:hypothetical protein [Parachlamydia sp. AcF125]|nr:hypothetical protein [Parachlamydia sp. AcF125]